MGRACITDIIIIIIIINSAQGRGWDHESECASKAGSIARWEMWQDGWGLDQRNGFSDDV